MMEGLEVWRTWRFERTSKFSVIRQSLEVAGNRLKLLFAEAPS